MNAAKFLILDVLAVDEPVVMEHEPLELQF